MLEPNETEPRGLTLVTLNITINSIMTNQGATTISAMDLRKEPGRVLDQVYYRGQSFIVERAGEPKAVIVPVRAYEQMERSKQEARQQLLKLTGQARQQVAQSGIREEELHQEIGAAVAAVRLDRRKSQPKPAYESGR